MALSRETAIISVHEELGTLLMLRKTVPHLFRKIDKLAANKVVLDFSKVEFMSRSFADQFIAAKTASRKPIGEQNVSIEVRRMLKIVSSQLATPRGQATIEHHAFPPPRAVAL